MKYYIKTKNDIIVSTSRNKKDGYTEIEFVPTIDTNINIYEQDGTIKPLSLCIKNGWLSIPNGYKIIDNEFVEMKQAEKIEAGQEMMPKGMKIVDGKLVEKTQVEKIQDSEEELPTGMKIVGKELVSKTNKERYDDAEITKEKYAEIIRAERDSLIHSLEDSDEYKKNIRLSRKDDKKAIDYIASADLYIEYLCDIPQGKNFPFVEILSFEDWKK